MSCSNHVQGSSFDFLNIHIRGEFNKFPDFFVQAFKIVVENSVCYCYTSYEMTGEYL